jgi:hypothetical protein
MKNRIVATCMHFVIGIIFLTSCEKSVGTNQNTPASVPTPALISGDPAFVGLFDALNHFDPHYLQLVYHDQRTTEEINLASGELFKKLSLQPQDIELQKELASFYKLNSIAELQYYSNQIVIHATAIRNKYYPQNLKLTDQQVITFFKARSLYARTKMDSIKNNTDHVKASSMYDDYVLNPQAPAFQFFGAMDLEGADANGECIDDCCFQWKSCYTSAMSKYVDGGNSTSFNTVASGVVIGGAIGSYLSPTGSIPGAFIGLYYSSIIGAATAMKVYALDRLACDYNYKACVIRNKK